MGFFDDADAAAEAFKRSSDEYARELTAKIAAEHQAKARAALARWLAEIGMPVDAALVSAETRDVDKPGMEFSEIQTTMTWELEGVPFSAVLNSGYGTLKVYLDGQYVITLGDIGEAMRKRASSTEP